MQLLFHRSVTLHANFKAPFIPTWPSASFLSSVLISSHWPIAARHCLRRVCSPSQTQTFPSTAAAGFLFCFVLFFQLCCWSVAQSCLTLCHPMNCSTPSFPVHHHLLSISCSNSCSLSQYCHPAISSSSAPFSSRPQFFPASGSFQ